ncbi:MAG: sigma-70 family RNA polymerase sigma factor [Bdellovibrionota bacterium]|nr:sigma-70 family RNA polymerase sigma factor [Bdellovibrionota bacterium]
MATDNFSSPDFILRLKKKEMEAVSQLVEKYNPVLYRGAMAQLKEPVSAEEVLADTWEAFFAAIDRFEGKSHIRTFLFGILYNKIRERRRHNARFIDLENPDPIIDMQFANDGHWANQPMDPERFVGASQDLEAVENCLEALAEKQKQAFYLQEVEGESREEICKILEVTSTNLGVLIYRAKNQLRICLEAKAVGL